MSTNNHNNVETDRITNMKAETMASLLKKLRNSTDPAETAAILKFICAKDATYTDEQLYALRFWYEQHHMLDRAAPRASLLSGEQIVEILLDKMDKYEFKIFNERLLLIRDHYPEKVRWHKKMIEGLGGGYGLRAQVMKSVHGEKCLQLQWQKATEKEKEFQWWC